METLKLINLCWQIFILRRKPRDMPRSIGLLALFALIFILLNIPSNIIFSEILTKIYLAKGVVVSPLTTMQSFISIMIYALILCTTIYSLLTYYKLQDRLVQVLTTMFAVEILLSIWFFALALVPDLRLLFGLMFFALLVWQFVINIYVFVNSLDVSVVKSALFALVYSIVQHKVDEYLMIIFMHRG